MTQDNDNIDDYDTRPSDESMDNEYLYDEIDKSSSLNNDNLDTKKKLTILAFIIIILIIFAFVFMSGDDSKTTDNNTNEIQKEEDKKEGELNIEDQDFDAPPDLPDFEENNDDQDNSFKLPTLPDIPLYSNNEQREPRSVSNNSDPFNKNDIQPIIPVEPRITPGASRIGGNRVLKPVPPQPALEPEPVIDSPIPIDNEAELQRNADALQAKLEKRRRSVMLINGGGYPDSSNLGDFFGIVSNRSKVEKTPVDSIKATYIGRTDLLIAQGKIIDGVLETAINSDLEGLLRAVVSRDIYAESGRRILIPKGSRLIGSYLSPDFGSSRIIITWERIIRPDGLDVVLSAPGVDSLGRAGVTGFVDNKYFDILSNSFLISAITIASSLAVDSINGSSTTTTTTTADPNGNQSNTQTANTTDAAVLDSLESFSDAGEQVLESGLDISPTIIVQQGVKIKVFVNQDITFPDSVTFVDQ